MQKKINRTTENVSRIVSSTTIFRKRTIKQQFGFIDNRPRRSGNSFSDNRLIQCFNIKIKYDPLNPQHKKETTVDTNDYTFIQLLEILIHSNNKEYLKNGSFETLMDHLILPEQKEKWFYALQQVPSLVTSADKCLQNCKKESPIKDIAKEYLEALLQVSNPDVYFTSVKLAKLSREEQQNERYSTFQSQAIKLKEEQKEEKKRQERLVIQERARRFIQLACYFAVEIPQEFAPQREEMLVFISKKGTIPFGLHSDELPEDITVNKVLDFIRVTQDRASEIVHYINEKKPGSFPMTYLESLPEPYRIQIIGLRKRIQCILAPYATLIADFIPGSKLKYRGSLADGIKNFTKSIPVITGPVIMDFGKKALCVNINAFDIDAFIEIPESLWSKWEEYGIIPDRKSQAIKGKILLETWIPMLEKIRHKNIAAYSEIGKMKCIRQLEIHVQHELIGLRGYKADHKTGLPEFEMVLQPESKTKQSHVYGKPYPMGELSRSGSAYQELLARFAQLKEEGVDESASWLQETDQTIIPQTMSPQKALIAINSPFRKLQQIDLTGSSVTVTSEMVDHFITMIEAGQLPFLREFKVDASAITSEHRRRAWAVLPLFFSLTNDKTLNY